MPAPEMTFGRVIAGEALGRSELGIIYRGWDSRTQQPAVVFSFPPERCREAEKLWFSARQLRPKPVMLGTTIIDAQNGADGSFMCVAWPAIEADAAAEPMPAPLAAVVKRFLAASPELTYPSIREVMAAVERLEPKQVPATVAIESNAMPAVWPPRPLDLAATAASSDLPLGPEPAPGFEPASEPPAARPSLSGRNPLLAHTKLLSNDAPAPTALPQPDPRHLQRSSTSASISAPATRDPETGSRAASPARPPQRDHLRWAAALSVVAMVVAAAVTVWTVMRAGNETPPSQLSSVVPSRTTTAPPVAPTAVKPASPRAAAPEQARAEPQASAPTDQAPAREGEPTLPQRAIVLLTAPSGAEVCDARTGKMLGRTPLSLGPTVVQAGQKLVLTAQGRQSMEMRWPPKGKLELKPLGSDQPEHVSPCAF